MNLLNFFLNRWETVMELTVEHLVLVITAMVISIGMGLIIGILITYNKRSARIILGIAGVCMTIPSLALFTLLIPIFHLGTAPAVVGLVIYTQLPIIRNVYTGIININPAIIESARGMGMSKFKIMYKIKLPLAFPVIIAGIRTSVVMGVGIGAIAAFVGAGGLGDYIFHGISRTNDKMILIGAIMISLLTIIIDRALYYVQKIVEVR